MVTINIMIKVPLELSKGKANRLSWPGDKRRLPALQPEVLWPALQPEALQQMHCVKVAHAHQPLPVHKPDSRPPKATCQAASCV